MARHILAALVFHLLYPQFGPGSPWALGVVQDTAWPLREAMATCIASASALAMVMVWSGPERALESDGHG